MINQKLIADLIGDHLPKYVYSAQEFIPGKTPVYYSGPYWDSKEIIAGINSFLNGKWLVAGENVHHFEAEFSKRFNVKYSHMVNSGSSANLILITALKKRFGWKDNDEVIVSPVGFPTTISVLCQNNLKPVFVDIEWHTLNFDVDKIEEKITPNTKAIFVSPVLGNPPDMDKLIALCEKYDLKLVGDNCDSLGSKWKGKYLGEYYVAYSNSFYPAHHITTGEGGMVCTDDEELKKLFVSFTWWGRACYCVGSANLLACGTCGNRFDKWLDNYDGIVDHKYIFDNMGYNLKPLDMQGAIGREQLKKLDEIDTKRVYNKLRIEDMFVHSFPNDGTIQFPERLSDAWPIWFGTPVICKDKDIKDRLVKHLEDNKIQTRNYFAGNILIHPGYQHLDDYNKYPEANKVLDKVFFIGCSPTYTPEILEYIDSVIKSFEI